MSVVDPSQPFVAVAGPAPAPPARHLYGPVLDILLLGGGSLLVLPVAFFVVPADASAQMMLWTTWLAHFVNNPHFAASYQIFYRKFTARAFGNEFPPALRWRYQLAGIGVPVGLAGYFLVCAWVESPKALGLGVNIMFFLVGWHYIKQGYGMLMLDAVLKRSYFDEKQKQALLYNGYLFWIFTYLHSNNASVTHDYWGIPYSKFDTPDAVVWGVGMLAALSFLRAVWAVWPKLLDRSRALPIAGLMAYFASVYVWLFVLNPLIWLMIPLFHSLQYLAVVWRYQDNYVADNQARDMFGVEPVRYRLWMGLFFGCSLALGYVGFWGLPQLLDRWVPYDHYMFSSALFIYMFWIFINVHHYALDSVMWRKENPDTRRYLFG